MSRTYVIAAIVVSACAVADAPLDDESTCVDGKCDYAGAHCWGANVIRASLPLYPTRATSPRFSYAFKYFPTTNRSATTVIVLNGGPGATLMDTTPYAPYALGAVPAAQFNIVFTDQRGSGCNVLPRGEFPEDALSTGAIAADVLSIVRRLGLTNYIVFGSSYGTVQATQVAALAQRAGLTAPRAVVLEGALGRSPAGGFDEYVAGYDAEWRRVQQQLPSDALTALSADPLPLGFSAETWGTLVQGSLLLGSLPGFEHPAVQLLTPLATGDRAGLHSLHGALQATQQSLASGELFPQLGEVVFCSELFGQARYSALREGELRASGRDRCTARTVAFAPYDSARYAVPSPIYYFHGERDPAVPEASARYHYDHQTNTYRAFVTVPAAGHGPLTVNLASLGCAATFWSAIETANATLLARAAAACGASIEGKVPQT
jgi:pimeloyl-ACP methyl ester carboxylesterase